MAADKAAIMAGVLEKLKADMPDEVVGKYKDIGSDMDVETISTGSLAIDHAIGGGFAKGRLVELVGFTSSGKTTLALTACAAMQRDKEDAVILYVDAENALDPAYAKMLGVDVDSMYIIQPNNGENGYLAAETFIKSGVADLVVIDSIAAMIPKAMLETDFGEQAQIGIGARLDSQGIAKIYAAANKTKTTVILINQWKKAVRINMYDVGDGVSGQYYQSGGQTLPFFLTQMLEIKRVGKLWEGDTVVSDQIRMTVRKNKIAPPYVTADFYISMGKGVDYAQEAIDFGVQFDLIEKSGRSMFTIVGVEESRSNGRQKFLAYLDSHPKELKDLRDAINLKMKEMGRGKSLTIGEDKEEVVEVEDGVVEKRTPVKDSENEVSDGSGPAL